MIANRSPAWSPRSDPPAAKSRASYSPLVDLGPDGVDFCRRLPDIGFSDLMRLGGKASYRLVIGKLGLIEPTLGKEGKMVGATGIEPVTPTMSARPRALRNVAHSLVSAKPCAP